MPSRTPVHELFTGTCAEGHGCRVGQGLGPAHHAERCATLPALPVPVQVRSVVQYSTTFLSFTCPLQSGRESSDSPADEDSYRDAESPGRCNSRSEGATGAASVPGIHYRLPGTTSTFTEQLLDTSLSLYLRGRKSNLRAAERRIAGVPARLPPERNVRGRRKCA